MAIHAWILQVRGKVPKQLFQLEPALKEALRRDRTLWLVPTRITSFNGPEHPVEGDRVYLNISGEKVEGSPRVGKIVALATALDKPVSHPMPEWQRKYSCGPGEIDDGMKRIKLHIDALIIPPLGRQEVYDAELEVREWQCFYQLSNTNSNVNRGTTFFVDDALDDVLAGLIQGRLTNIESAPNAPNQIPLSEEDARTRKMREVNERSGQSQFRKALLREGVACAFTGTRVEEALEAAHIMPYRGIQTNDPNNGLLLRADVHTLFDRGLLRIDPSNGQIQVDNALEGSIYEDLDGKEVRNRERLRKDALDWRWAHPDLVAWARG